MSQRRLNHGSEVGSVSIAPYEYAAVYDYLGKNRYLQASFCKSAAKLYSDKFSMYTTKALSNIAAEEGFIGLLEWSKEIGCFWCEGVFVSGARGGNIDVLKFLQNNDCPMPPDQGYRAWIAATLGGHLEVLKFAYNSKYLQRINLLCNVAAINGHLNILKWMYEVEGITHFNAETCQLAAEGGFLEIIQWLRSSVGCEWDGRTCRRAVDHGHVGVLKWAIDNGCPWGVDDTSSGETALHLGPQNVEVIEFLVSRGANINALATDGETPLYSAVLYSRLEAVKTFVRLGADVNIADLDGRTPLDIAIKYRRREIVEVLRGAGARE